MKDTNQSGRRRVTHPEEAVFLDLLRTTDVLSRGLIHVLKAGDLSATQYNVLRILRGTPAGAPATSPSAVAASRSRRVR